MADDTEPGVDGGRQGDDAVAGVRSYTVRLELVDEPGELLRTLQPIADNGGNLLSIFHERGNLTPRGHIPVEVDLECTPDRFDVIVAALRDAGVNVIQAGAERYSEEMTVLLVGHLIDTDLSDTLNRIEECSGASVADISLSSPEGTADASAARLRLAVESGRVDDVLAAMRSVAEDKDLRVIEPLTGGGEAA
ncbi:amino acid-binding protein [Halostella litorea]|uniref:amino acid-binding protein n=1 Tax=Halostella litorea TaxID=2528831 RepID=UPI0035C05281